MDNNSFASSKDPTAVKVVICARAVGTEQVTRSNVDFAGISTVLGTGFVFITSIDLFFSAEIIDFKPLFARMHVHKNSRGRWIWIPTAFDFGNHELNARSGHLSSTQLS